MSINKQKNIWDKHWKGQINVEPQKILNSHFTQEAYYCLKNFIDERKDKIILEAGCGTGRFCCLLAKNFPNSKVIGMDVSPNSHKIANSLKEYLKVSNVSFETGNLFQIPYPKDYFDIVFNDGVIEHFSLEDTPTYKDALQEMIRVTKPGGKVIVDVPNWYCLPHSLYKWILNKLGRLFEYGYEKSFRHKDLIELFREFNLINLELKGYYPAHGFYRFSKYSRIFSLLGKIVDKLDNKYITNIFGFMILIKGEKL